MRKSATRPAMIHKPDFCNVVLRKAHKIEAGR